MTVTPAFGDRDAADQSPGSLAHPRGARPVARQNGRRPLRPRLLEPLPQQNLRDRVVAAIRDAIVRGTLRPGEKIPEDELAKQLGVSRTPVREAIRILEQQGLVRVRPKNGTFIAKVDHRDVADGLAVRIALEELAAREAIERLSDDHWAAMCAGLEGLLGRMEDAIAASDAVTATELDIEFHWTLVRASDNRVLARTWRLIDVPLLVWSPERELYPQSQAELIEGLSDRHTDLLNALRTRDPSISAAAVRRHIERKLDDIAARPTVDAPVDPGPASPDAVRRRSES